MPQTDVSFENPFDAANVATALGQANIPTSILDGGILRMPAPTGLPPNLQSIHWKKKISSANAEILINQIIDATPDPGSFSFTPWRQPESLGSVEFHGTVDDLVLDGWHTGYLFDDSWNKRSDDGQQKVSYSWKPTPDSHLESGLFFYRVARITPADSRSVEFKALAHAFPDTSRRDLIWPWLDRSKDPPSYEFNALGVRLALDYVNNKPVQTKGMVYKDGFWHPILYKEMNGRMKKFTDRVELIRLCSGCHGHGVNFGPVPKFNGYTPAEGWAKFIINGRHALSDPAYDHPGILTYYGN